MVGEYLAELEAQQAEAWRALVKARRAIREADDAAKRAAHRDLRSDVVGRLEELNQRRQESVDAFQLLNVVPATVNQADAEAQRARVRDHVRRAGGFSV